MHALALSAVLLFPQDATDPRIVEALASLKADEIERRETAARELVRLGEPALPALRRELAAESDAEVRGRIESIVAQIEKEARVAAVLRPVKRVTLAVSETPLAEAVQKACGQAGVDCIIDPDIAGRPVTLEARDEPLLKTLDRLCARRKDVRFEVVGARVKLGAGQAPAVPTAYADGFRARLQRIVVTDRTDFEQRTSSVVLSIEVDWQPDVKARVASYSAPPKGRDEAGREIVFTPVATAPQEGAMLRPPGVQLYLIGGMDLRVTSTDELDRMCFAREAPAGLRRLDILRVPFRLRLPVGRRTIRAALGPGRAPQPIPGLPFVVSAERGNIGFSSVDHTRIMPRLEEYFDTESAAVVGDDGRRHRCTREAHAGLRVFTDTLRCEAEVGNLREPELRLEAFEYVDREIEFEFRGVALRE